jgi:hypothetical protein
VDQLIANNHASTRKGITMNIRMMRRFGLLVLVCLLVVQVAGCASMKLSSKKLCESGGGVYSGGACNPGKAMKASEMCMAAGGDYIAGEDYCEIGGNRSR